jgi:outer membrane protein insertion porin family
MRILFLSIFILLNIFIADKCLAQQLPSGTFSYTSPEEYEIAEISFTGIASLDANALKSITGLKEGDKIVIPGEDLSSAIKKIWEQKLVGDVTANITKVEGNRIWINFHLTERPRVSKINFEGARKSDREELKNKVNISLGQIVTDAMIKNGVQKIKQYYIDKGYLNVKVTSRLENDTTLRNSNILTLNIIRGKKVRIDEISITGNEKERNTRKEKRQLSDNRLKRKMKETKEKSLVNILSSSKFKKEEFEKDKQLVIDYLNSHGFRDARIVRDTIYPVKKHRIKIEMNIEEGNKYYFRNITWKGNYIYPDRVLDTILNIKKGETYNVARLEKKLNYNPDGYDISSLYLDDGYLFFRVEPIEILVENDSIDIEMRIYEGPQATIKNVTVSGNTKTHDHVVLRELHTVPGQKFSRADLIRSQREIATLGYFDQEQIGINPVPNASDGTVDINYTVVEKPSDQIELSGGWGGGLGFVGTLGLVFNNFSLKNISKFKTWDPLPSGDGQRLSVRFQASGRYYQTYSFSFTEPWLGGKKPHSLTFGLTRSQQNRFNPDKLLDVIGFLRVQGGSVSFGKRLKWPDDYFSMSYTLSYMQYRFKNYYKERAYNPLGISNGTSNNISFAVNISRNSLNDFTFPTSGSTIGLNISATPPYSLFSNKNYPSLPDEERYKLVEMHKWTFDNSWFTTLVPGKKRNLVLNTRFHFGAVGAYKSSTGVGPFERFIMGGNGLSGIAGSYILGSELIGLRGYSDNVIVPVEPDGKINGGGRIFDKFVTELRYPVNLSPALSVIVLGFFEAGNTWDNFKNFNPFKVYRSTGVGTRIMMPAFGMIGIDWGYRLDDVPGNPSNKSRVTFVIGQQIR